MKHISEIPIESIPLAPLALVRPGARASDIDSIETNTDSVIEAILYRALIEFLIRQGWPFVPFRKYVQWGFVQHRVPTESIAICPQEPIGRIRPDFVLRMRFPFIQNAVVEVDGRAWHSSDEAKERDRKRDILLTGLGYRVLRFTGREIMINPERCARDVLRLFDPWLDDDRPIWVRVD